jgi:hypothetical protein
MGTTNEELEVLGISRDDYAWLAHTDHRIVTSVALANGGSSRLRRWLHLGSPAADLGRFDFRGNEAVRNLVEDVLRQLPPPVAWHATEFVSFVEVGRTTAGGFVVLPRRSPVDDQRHVIVLFGGQPDSELRMVIAHEIGHSWSSDLLRLPVEALRWSGRELMTHQLAAAKRAGLTHEQLVRELVGEERLADDLAKLWGFECATNEEWLERHFRDRVAAAAELADRIESENGYQQGAQ